MITLWTGSKELHSTSDDKIGPNEEEDESSNVNTLLSATTSHLMMVGQFLIAVGSLCH